MEKYDYRAAMVKDIKEYIKDNSHALNVDPLEEDDITSYWYDMMWSEDCITGNNAYYYDTEEKCEEYLKGNLKLYFEAARELQDETIGHDAMWKKENPAQYMDATIRCYLLYECIDRALEELNN